jgi:hypothetical protein
VRNPETRTDETASQQSWQRRVKAFGNEQAFARPTWHLLRPLNLSRSRMRPTPRIRFDTHPHYQSAMLPHSSLLRPRRLALLDIEEHHRVFRDKKHTLDSFERELKDLSSHESGCEADRQSVKLFFALCQSIHDNHTPSLHRSCRASFSSLRRASVCDLRIQLRASASSPEIAPSDSARARMVTKCITEESSYDYLPKVTRVITGSRLVTKIYGQKSAFLSDNKFVGSS